MASLEEVQQVADRVHPVPKDVIPGHIQEKPASLQLYKKEWRNAQRMRAAEERLLPNVIRSSFPPEAGPHGVASHPPPSYTTPTHAKLPARRAQGISFGALDTPGPRGQGCAAADAGSNAGIGVGRYYPGAHMDFSEGTMDQPGADYVMLRPTVRLNGKREEFGKLRAVSRRGKYGRTVARVVLTEDSRHSTSALAPPKTPGVTHSYSPRQLSESMRHSYSTFKAASKTSSAPFTIDLGMFGAPPERSGCPSDHNPLKTRQSTVKSPDLLRKVAHAHGSPMPGPAQPHALFDEASRPESRGRFDTVDVSRSRGTTASHQRPRTVHAHTYSTTDSVQSEARRRVQAVHDSSLHTRKTAANLRSYNVNDMHHRPPTAISTVATTFARPPKSAHVSDATLAAPSERIGANYSLDAWGLSPRTMQFLSPEGVREGCTLKRARDLDGIEDASPEGVPYADPDALTAHTRKRMAFMPLELFDDPDYESHTPQEWVESGVAAGGARAQSRWYNMQTDQYEQRPVRVIDYDADEDTFRVKFEHNGMLKTVKRLNLRFEEESEELFERRLNAANAQRKEHEAALRWRFYLDTNDVEEVIDTYDFERKVVAVLSTCYRVTDGVFDAKREELIEDFYADYCLAVRIACLDYHRRNPAIERKLSVLSLPPIAQKPLAPLCGVLDIVDAGTTVSEPFDAVLLWGSTTMFNASPIVLGALQRLHGLFMKVRSQLSYALAPATHDFLIFRPDSTFSTDDAGRLPWSLKCLEALCSSHTATVVAYIQSLSLEALNICNSSELRTAVNGGVPESAGQLGEGSIALLVRASLNMRAVCRAMTLDAAEAFAADIEAYVDEQSEGVLRESQPLHELWGRGPMLRVDLQYSVQDVICSPSLDTVKATIMTQLDELASALPQLSDDLLGAIDLDVSAPPLTRDGWASEARFAAARERVAAALSKACHGVEEIQKQFADIAADLLLSKEEVLAEVAGKAPDIGNYAKRLEFLRERLDRLESLCASQIYTGLIMVDTQPMKVAVLAHIRELSSALLEDLRERELASNADIINAFAAQEALILRVSENTAECLQLSKDIAAAEEQLVRLQEVIAANKAIDSFLLQNRWPVPDHDVEVSCEAYGGPLRMTAAIERATAKANNEHTLFQRKLKADVVRLQADIEDFSAQVSAFAQLSNLEEQIEHAAQGRALMGTLEDAAGRAAHINSEEALFELPRSEWPRISQLQKELQPYLDLWNIVSEFNIQSENWLNEHTKTLNAEQIDEDVNEWFKKMTKLSRSLPRDDLKSVADALREKLSTFRTYLGLIACICNPGMQKRHWDRIMASANMKEKPETLQGFLEAGLLEHEQALQDLSDSATREHALEKQLEKMQSEWQGVEFELAPWKNTGGFILKGSSVDEAQMLLDDHSIKSQAMMSSPFCVGSTKDRNEEFTETLMLMQKIFDAWLTCQVKWMYLGPVYGSEEIAKQMPAERKQFTVADSKYRRIMVACERKPEVWGICKLDGLLDDLLEANRAFTTIEKSLNDYLDTKKLAFPRFFFLSNDELLEILSETKDPLNVQPFVKKCFEAVQELAFDPKNIITGCTSIEGEKIAYDKPVDPNGEANGVERWLLQTEEVMMGSLHTITRNAVKAYEVQRRDDWLLSWPGQVVLAVSQIYWTRAVAEALGTGGVDGLKKYAGECSESLKAEVSLVRGELTKLQRATLGALVVIDVHARDVLVDMSREGVSQESDFSWQAQLRYYWEEDTVLVRMLNAVARYGYEYLGNSSRLVITPLTDRCYRTLLGAHHLNLGGAPAGPAGTGKTETTKDLSKAVAIQCVVFNCSDQLDYIAMGKFFKGLAASGAWACFDEFNRIELEVLSVVAQQVLTIQRAKAAGKQRFVFEGVELPLIHTCNCFITMNPGYAGRSELPDNLKALFRDVAMMVPDYAMISEIILYSFGYFEARALGVKLVQTYRLCSEQLSKQDHYDYGMRAVVAVLRAAGNLKRKFPDQKEDVLMLRAINDVNLPKFLDEDVPLFLGILSDLFPGISLPDMDYTDMTAALKDNCAKMHLQPLDSFIIKIIQLYEMIVVRHGLMMVGWSFGMKTAAIRVLAAALSDLNERGQCDEFKVKTWTLNPKSVTMGQLYGEDDPVSKEWSDGILAVAFRNAARDVSGDRKWIVLDGPVDAIWIENMNTVLDDNKKLCLNSGEIIAMQGLMNMIFEVQDLAVASPATVSRCGMVYVQPSLLGRRPLVESWAEVLPASYSDRQKDLIFALCDWILPPALRLVTKYLKQPVQLQEQNLVTSLLRLYQSELDVVFSPELESPPPMKPSDVEAALQNVFLFSVVWSLGASVDAAGRVEFDKELRNYLESKYDDRVQLVVTHEGVKLNKPFPKDGSVFDYVYLVEQSTWKEWLEVVPPQQLTDVLEFQNITVLTLDVVRYTYLMNTFVQHHYPVLLMGPTGTGKSVYMKDYLTQKLDKATWVYMTFGFSAQTSVNMTQDIIDGKLDKRRKGVFGPPVNKRAVIFVDDLNMPQVETYGAQPPIELLRQYMDHEGWYDRKELTFRKLVDIQFCSAMGPPGGGRNNVTNRYVRHFSLISMTEFDDSSKRMIFSKLADWWLSKARYGEDLKRLGPKMVDASLQIYTESLKELLPTPTRSHYTFNLRDLSKIFQGMQTAGNTLKDSEDAVRLWVHETMRVFMDRLIDEGDRKWFADALQRAAEQHFRVKWEKVLGRIADERGEVGHVQLRSLLFGDFMIQGADPQLYVELGDMQEVTKVVTDYLAEYNANSKAPMQLVLFTFAIEHVTRICRMIRQPGGHALLVGLGGSGRQSLTRLAAFMEDYTVKQIEITSTYSRNDWCDDLKDALRTAGEKGKPTVFLFADTQIKEETMVEDISNLLNTGEVPNLFDASDQLQIGTNVQPRAKKVGMDGSRADLYNFFCAEIRRYLHIVLTFSPIGDAFRTRLRKFPSLVTSTTINWFTAWPDDALRSTAERYLSDTSLEDDLRVKIGEQCMVFHSGVRDMTARYLSEAKRYFYVTPTSYLELLNAYKSLLEKRSREVSDAKYRYQNGLEKLLFTEGQVNSMKEELEVLKPQLVQASKETDELLVNVERETADADKVKAVVAVDEAAAQEEAAAVNAIKEECEADLAEAMPALNAAIKALDTLTKNDIGEVKQMKSPPAAVKMVLEAVCVIKGVKPTKVKDADSGKMVMDYWESAKKMLTDSGFLDSLRTFDKDNIDPEIIKKLQPIITREDFDPKKILKVSKACFGLASWVKAMDTYDRVAKVVGPKRAALAEAEAKLKVVMDALAVKQAELKTIVDKLNELDRQLTEAKTKKGNLEAEFKLCSEKLDRANKLITGLGGEKTRWTECAASLGEQLNALSGDYIAYLGPFTSAYRSDALASWVKSCKDADIPRSETFSFSAALGDPVRIRHWNICGLPKDDFSCCNGIILNSSNRWPLCIDPQGQTNKWIRTMHADDQLVIVKLTDGNYLRRMETAIQMGQPVLLENVAESLDASLEPVLLKQTFKSAGQLMIKLGDSNVEWSPHFKFYMTTKLRNPHYPPELCTKVVLLNFMITPEGLEDQLLGIVVAQERPDLEKQKNQLIIQGAENKKKLKEIEDQILHVLSSSEGNILEDEGAVNILQESKIVSDDINRKQKAAEKTEKAIDEARLSYAPIAGYVSVLFFCVADMSAIDPMYQYSLTYFIMLFLRSIETSEKAKEVPKRLENLKSHFTFFLYVNVCRSLFEVHKLLFAFNLSTKLSLAEGHITARQLKFFLTGGIAMDNPHRNPAERWLSAKMWGEVCRLNDVGGAFDGIRQAFEKTPAAWESIVESKEPHNEPMPPPWDTKLSKFEQLVVLRCLRPDKLVAGMQNYIVHSMGARYVEPQEFKLEPIYEDSQANVPLIFVLSAGSDPMTDLLMFADTKGKRTEAVSLGQGQGPVAERWIKQALTEGFWVVLQNCHLAKSFLPRLEQMCEKELNGDGVHPEFRLWLTSYPSPIFPIAILENGLKITNEAPRGMRAGMERVYKADPVNDIKHFFEGCSKETEFKAMCFGLAFFHCMIGGRKAYGPVGWNIPYQFNENDLRISMRQLRMFLDEYDEVPLDMLVYTCGECNYGGKVTDGKDRRTLMTLLSFFYCEDILDGGYSLTPSGNYVVPDTGPHESYLEYLSTLPLIEEPEVFGLHENATITKDLQSTQVLLDALLLTQPRDGGGGGRGAVKSEDDVIFDTAADILAKLPADFDTEATQRKYPIKYEDSMNTVLVQELGRVNVLLQRIRSSLVELKKAVRGLVLLSSELEKVGKALLIGKVPDHWLAKSFPSLKPLGPYVKEVLERCQFFQRWIDEGPPIVFWLPGFFFTQAFLTSAKQNFARKYTIPIDIVDFDFVVKDKEGDCDKRPDDGVFVHGMFFEAADWDYEAHELTESKPKVLFAHVPNMLFVPNKVADFAEFPHYTCPMYKTSERRGVLSTTGHSTNFVMDVRVPTSLGEKHWIKRGTAMLTSLDD